MMCAVTRPLLSYVLASYTPSDFLRSTDDLQLLRSIGFRVVTFIPTYYLVECENGGLRLDASKTPSFADQTRAFRTALEMGFILRVTPHVDMRGKWRGEVAMDPLAPFAASDLTYESAILQPTLQALNTALAEADVGTSVASPTAILTFGSELEKSVGKFAAHWCELLQRMQARRGTLEHGERVEFCHNLNWDHRWRTWFNFNRDEYIKALDRVSFSFYPPVFASEKDAGHLSDDRRAAYERCTKWMNDLNQRVDLGEIGLGSARMLRPNEYCENAFDGPQGAAAREVRRRYWAAMLEFLSRCDENKMACASPLHATIWSVGVYNILGACGRSDRRDEALVEMIARYNAGQRTAFE